MKIHDFYITSFGKNANEYVDFQELHSNDCFEIIWLKNGSGIHLVDMIDHFYEGSVLFILSPSQLHKITQQQATKGYIVKFQPSLFKKESDFLNYLLDTCLFDSVNSCPVIQIPKSFENLLEELFSQMQKECEFPQSDSYIILNSYLKILTTNINRIKRAYITLKLPISDSTYALYRKFKLAVEENFKKEHSVQFYADRLDIPTKTLNLLCKKYTGRSTIKIIQERIILEIQRSLFHELKSIKEICFELGFDDPAYFTRFFKKYTGTTPQQFKEQKNVVA